MDVLSKSFQSFLFFRYKDLREIKSRIVINAFQGELTIANLSKCSYKRQTSRQWIQPSIERVLRNHGCWPFAIRYSRLLWSLSRQRAPRVNLSRYLWLSDGCFLYQHDVSRLWSLVKVQSALDTTLGPLYAKITPIEKLFYISCTVCLAKSIYQSWGSGGFT